jgi:hypothetical protein
MLLKTVTLSGPELTQPQHRPVTFMLRFPAIPSYRWEGLAGNFGRISSGVSVGRAVGGVIAGVVTATILVLAIETAGLPLFPQPEGMDVRNMDSVRQHLSDIHPGSFIMVLIAWSTAAFAGPWVARRIAGNAPAWPSLLVALLFLALCTYNLVVVPTPMWMIVGALILVPLATWLGLRTPLTRGA